MLCSTLCWEHCGTYVSVNWLCFSRADSCVHVRCPEADCNSQNHASSTRWTYCSLCGVQRLSLHVPPLAPFPQCGHWLSLPELSGAACWKWIMSVQSHQYHVMRSHQTPSSSGQEPGLGLVYFPVSRRVPSTEGKQEEKWVHWNNGSSTWKDQHGLDQSERFWRKQNMTSVTCVIEYRVEQNPKNMHNVAFYAVSHMCTHVYLFTYVCDAYVHLYLCCMQTNTHPGSEGGLSFYTACICVVWIILVLCIHVEPFFLIRGKNWVKKVELGNK